MSLQIVLTTERQDGNTLTTEDDFEVELEAAQEGGSRKKPKLSREKRNERYGFGGSKRQVKRNDDDAGDLSALDKRRRGFQSKGKPGKRKGKAQRPGKQRRMQKR
jgi:rRNA-processing protein EBP2